MLQTLKPAKEIDSRIRLNFLLFCTACIWVIEKTRMSPLAIIERITLQVRTLSGQFLTKSSIVF